MKETSTLQLAISSLQYLKLLNLDNSDELFLLVDSNREHLRVWLPWLDSVTEVSSIHNFIDNSLINYRQGKGFELGIHYEGQIVGVIGFHGFDSVNRQTSVGYWLAASFTGKGIMRNSVIACCQYAFNCRRMNRFSIRCATDNIPSRKIPESLGFKHEGCNREAEWLYDHFVDLEQYSLLRKEYLSYDWSKAGRI